MTSSRTHRVEFYRLLDVAPEAYAERPPKPQPPEPFVPPPEASGWMRETGSGGCGSMGAAGSGPAGLLGGLLPFLALLSLACIYRHERGEADA